MKSDNLFFSFIVKMVAFFPCIPESLLSVQHLFMGAWTVSLDGRSNRDVVKIDVSEKKVRVQFLC